MSNKVKVHFIDGKYINLFDITMYEIQDGALVISLVNREPLIFNVPMDIPDVQEAFEDLHTKMLELETTPVLEVKVTEPVTVTVDGIVTTQLYEEPVEEPEEPEEPINPEEPPEEEPPVEDPPEEPIDE